MNISSSASLRFKDHKNGFSQILSDPQILPKILLSGFLLINPFLVAFSPAYFSGKAPHWVALAMPWILAFNVLSFWFPLGFTYEVLRRAREGHQPQLPDWQWSVLPRYAYEGSVKLLLALFTLIIPVGLWMGACWTLFIYLLGLPAAMMSLFLPPILLLVIPFCGVACCRWLDGASAFDCALNYPKNIQTFRLAWKDYLLASAFIIGVNSVTTAFFYTIPFGAVFGLCLVDTWFGPIYAESVRRSVPVPMSLRRATVSV